MSDNEGKVLWQEIEPLPPWEAQHLFLLSRSIWSCCRLLVYLMLFSKVHFPYLSASGSSLVKKLAASLNLPFHTVSKNLPLTPCTTFRCRKLRPTSATILPTGSEEAYYLLLPLDLLQGPWHLISHNQRSMGSQPEVHGLSPGPYWRAVHRPHPSCEEETIYWLNGNKFQFAVTSELRGRLFQTHH